MLKFVFSIGLSAVLLSALVLGQGGTPDIGIQPGLALGNVTSTTAGKIVLMTKDGEISAVLGSSTEYKRLPPDNLQLSAATPASFSDISVGDRVLVTGKVSEDKKTMTASRVFLVKGSDLEQLAEKQRREWRTRGIAGKVAAVDAETKTVTVTMSSLTGASSTLQLTPKEDAKFLKYAEGSVRYADAVKSDFAGIEVGDNIQALGDRTPDGTAFKAEEILSGGFVTVAGTVKSVDLEKNEIVVTHFNTKEDIVIKINPNSSLKKFPDEMASRIAMFLQFSRNGGGPRRAGGNGTGGGQRAEGSQQGARRSGENSGESNQAGNNAQRNGENGRRGGQMGGGPRGGMGDINTIASRIPDIKIEDLKEGDQIAASSPKSKDEKNYTAIRLIAGIGPFIAAQASSGGGGRGRGVGGSLEIPGLDNVEF